MSYFNLSSIVLPEESTIEPTIEEKIYLIRSILTSARELSEQAEFWNELKREAKQLALEEDKRETEQEEKVENEKAKKARELEEREDFWKDIKREAFNLALAEEQRENKQKRSKIQALDPSSLAKLIHYIHKQKQNQDKSFLHIIEDIDTDFTDFTDFIRAIYSPGIKFNNKQLNKNPFRIFDNTKTDTITDHKSVANESMAGYKRKSKHYKSKHYKSKHYKSKHKRYKNTNRKKNAQFRRTIRRLNKKTKNM